MQALRAQTAVLTMRPTAVIRGKVTGAVGSDVAAAVQLLNVPN
jgi:hypothetical protein